MNVPSSDLPVESTTRLMLLGGVRYLLRVGTVRVHVPHAKMGVPPERSERSGPERCSGTFRTVRASRFKFDIDEEPSLLMLERADYDVAPDADYNAWMILEPEGEADAATAKAPATPLEADAMEGGVSTSGAAIQGAGLVAG